MASTPRRWSSQLPAAPDHWRARRRGWDSGRSTARRVTGRKPAAISVRPVTVQCPYAPNRFPCPDCRIRLHRLPCFCRVCAEPVAHSLCGGPRAGSRYFQAIDRDQHYRHAAGQCDHGHRGHAEAIFDAFGTFWGWFSIFDLTLTDWLTLVSEFIGMTALAAGNVIVVPIRSGVGLRLGANIGYLKFTPQATWNPL